MSYGVNSIQIHKKLRLDKRAGSDNWYARLTLPSGKRLIKTSCPQPLANSKMLLVMPSIEWKLNWSRVWVEDTTHYVNARIPK